MLPISVRFKPFSTKVGEEHQLNTRKPSSGAIGLALAGLSALGPTGPAQVSVDPGPAPARVATQTPGVNQVAETPANTGEYSFYIVNDSPGNPNDSSGNVSFTWSGKSYHNAISEVTTSQVPGKNELQVNLFGRAYLSSGAGAWFQSNTANTNGQWQDVGLNTWASGNSAPSQLYFAITGALTVNGQTNTVVLGQGFHVIPAYNWWVGGSNT